MERVLGAELSHHLGYEKGDPAGRGSGNSRNGHSSKTVLSEDGDVELCAIGLGPSSRGSCQRAGRDWMASTAVHPARAARVRRARRPRRRADCPNLQLSRVKAKVSVTVPPYVCFVGNTWSYRLRSGNLLDGGSGR